MAEFNSADQSKSSDVSGESEEYWNEQHAQLGLKPRKTMVN